MSAITLLAVEAAGIRNTEDLTRLLSAERENQTCAERMRRLIEARGIRVSRQTSLSALVSLLDGKSDAPDTTTAPATEAPSTSMWARLSADQRAHAERAGHAKTEADRETFAREYFAIADDEVGTDNSAAAASASAPGETAAGPDASHWSKLTKEQKDFAKKMGQDKTADMREKFAKEYLKISGK